MDNRFHELTIALYQTVRNAAETLIRDEANRHRFQVRLLNALVQYLEAFRADYERLLTEGTNAPPAQPEPANHPSTR